MRTIRCMLVLVLIVVSWSAVIGAEESFVTFTEYTQEGRTINLMEGKFMYYVDINSMIHVKFFPEKLGFDSDIIATPESKKLRAEVLALKTLLVEGRDELSDYVEQMGNLRESLLKDPTPEKEQEFRSKLKGRGSFILNLLDTLEKVFTEEQLGQALSTPDPTYNDLLKLLAEHLDKTQENLSAETQDIIQKNELSLSVWCIQRSKSQHSAAIHLRNYDSLEMGSEHEVKKITFGMSQAEMTHLDENYGLYQDIQDLAEDIQNKDSELRKIIGSLKTQLVSELKELEGLFGSKDIEQILDELTAKLAKLPADDKFKELEGVLVGLKDKFLKLSVLRDDYEDLIREILTISEVDSTTQIRNILSKLDTLSKLMSDIRKAVENDLYGSVVHSIQEVKELSEELEKELPIEISNKIAGFLNTTAQSWTKSLAELEQILAKNNYYSDYKSAFQGLIERISFVSAVGDRANSEQLKPQQTREVNLANAPPTVIDIPATRRQEDDIYTLYVQITGQGSPVIRREFSFVVKRYGVFNNWANNFVFVKGGWQEAFQPAFAVSWILHYGNRPNDSGKWRIADYLYNDVLNPGVGLSSVMISREDKVEYGLGVALTLFSDNVEIGYGMNFGKLEQEGRYYFYVGAALFDWLNPASLRKGMIQ